MPTKIVASKSDPKQGLINQQDLRKITQDFEDFVEINTTISRAFKKINTVTIPLALVKHLLKPYEDKIDDHLRMNIKFGITLPGQKDCETDKIDVSNHLTALLVIEEDGLEHDEINDFVIVAAFRENNENGNNDGPCCPVIKP